MYVLAINGSPNPCSNTSIAIEAALEPLRAAGICTEVVTVGSMALRSCAGCGLCRSSSEPRCVIEDGMNEIAARMFAADGIIIASPVHFGGISGALKCLLDRAHYCGSHLLAGKVCAAMVVQRRTGGMDALRQIENYFVHSSVYTVPARYWGILHGGAPGEVRADLEGMANARLTGLRMAQMLSEGMSRPADSERVRTSFIR